MAGLARWAMGGLVLVTLLGDYPSASAQGRPAAVNATGSRDAALQQAAAELARWAEEGRGRAGIAVIGATSERLLAAAGESVPLNPASNQKLLTAATALARLGPEFRYTTGVYGKIERGAAAELVLRGHGDPSFSSQDLWQLGVELVGRGLERVTGGILVDQSRFDQSFVPPGFDQQPNEWAAFRAPVSALALDENALVLNVAPGEVGEPAATWIEPAGYATVTGSIETKAEGGGNGARFSVERGGGGRLRALIGGHIAHGLPLLRFSRRIDDPRLVAGFALKHVLERLGVKVAGEVAEGGVREKHALALHRSEPLGKLLQALGKDSNNFYAEMVLKTLGAEVKGAPGSSAAGAEVVLQWLEQAGGAAPGTRITNGSGLFDTNRLTAGGLARAVAAAYRDPAIGPDFVAQLAIGGTDGTLRSRFRGYRAARAIRAKTGTLDRAIALSGLVLAPAGKEPVAFSILVADLPGKHAESRRRIDQIVTRIADRLYGP